MQIKIGNSVIPMEPSISLPLVLSSPLILTSENKIPGSYIFNSSFPSTEGLRKEFNQAHRPQRHGKATAELPYVITNGPLRFSGTCIVTQADKSSYDISFLINNGDITNTWRKKTLKDLDLGGARVMADVYSFANTSAYYCDTRDSTPFVFTMNCPSAIGSDITGSMSDSGRTFVSPITGTLHQKNILIIDFINTTTAGHINITFLKNGTPYQEYANLVSNETFENTVDVVIGDILTVLVEGVSGMLNNEDAFVGQVFEFTHEFSTTNMFTEVSEMNQDNSCYALFPVLNSHFLDNFPDDAFQLDNLSLRTLYTEYFPILNYFINGEFPMVLTGVSEGETFTCGNLFTPFIYMNTLLTLIAKDSGYSIINNPFSREFYGAVLLNTYAENTYATESTTLLPVKPSYDLIDHVPAVTQSDFISWIARLTGSMPVVDNNACTITFVDIRKKHLVSETNLPVDFPGKILEGTRVNFETSYKGIRFEMKRPSPDKFIERMIKELHSKLVYKGDVEDGRFLPTEGNKVNDMYYGIRNNSYFVYQYDPETYTLTWTFFGLKFPLIYKEGEEPFLEVISELAPVVTRRIQDESLMAPEWRIMYLPITEQAGTLEGFPDSFASECGNQVLYYKGMVNDSLGNPYPLGSSRRQDYGNPDGPMYPDLNADSIFDNQYKEFLRWLAYDAKLVTFQVLLSPGQLQQLKFDQIYSGNGFIFLIKEIRVNLQYNGISIAELDVYSC